MTRRDTSVEQIYSPLGEAGACSWMRNSEGDYVVRPHCHANVASLSLVDNYTKKQNSTICTRTQTIMPDVIPDNMGATKTQWTVVFKCHAQCN